ncbi:Light harvesting complex protein [Ectocarpus siliculosus]|uniref:Light harvesting complex protein n=1 Tax=Ectocarpus siliculosus TaxID=2880 RepID=D7FWY5_ECTSI|nr:Light harvesting complex protein [Ectocarpus siliculosus]|eukprot:CBJ32223.1 Light harvesting complex protein [Ectocarpus siliculosus]
MYWGTACCCTLGVVFIVFCSLGAICTCVPWKHAGWLILVSTVKSLRGTQIFAFIGFLELAVMKNVEGSFPGDFTLGGNPFGSSWDAMSEETQASKRAIELNNGRAAQMGILALMVHEELNNKPYVINDLLGAGYTFN